MLASCLFAGGSPNNAELVMISDFGKMNDAVIMGVSARQSVLLLALAVAVDVGSLLPVIFRTLARILRSN